MRILLLCMYLCECACMYMIPFKYIEDVNSD